MTTTASFIQHIERFTGPISSEETSTILSCFHVQTNAKKTCVLEVGTPCDSLFFVLQGCLRSYYIKDKGTEQTLDFAIEKWWLTDFMAFEYESVSNFYIQAVETTQLLRISKLDFQLLLTQHPRMEKYFRCVFQRAYAAAQYRVKFLYEFSREELYFHFEKNFPDFIQRIPQYLLASYLGFSPQYLSEIKKKRFS
ncbi:Crp/Fnr family transcriptional regulator [Myroides odoratus]|uniref:Crp/Fnr family transcriptional regulator n=1 Tax=Myroides odoratus TaxID=256 RepID=UPI0039AFEBFC